MSTFNEMRVFHEVHYCKTHVQKRWHDNLEPHPQAGTLAHLRL